MYHFFFFFGEAGQQKDAGTTRIVVSSSSSWSNVDAGSGSGSGQLNRWKRNLAWLRGPWHRFALATGGCSRAQHSELAPKMVTMQADRQAQAMARTKHQPGERVFIKVAWNQQLSTARVRSGVRRGVTRSGGWLMPNSWGRGWNRSRTRSIDFDVPQCCYLNFYWQLGSFFIDCQSHTHTYTHTQWDHVYKNSRMHLEQFSDSSRVGKWRVAS